MGDKKIPMSELPFTFGGLADRYGDIVWAERFCTGVYYIGTQKRQGNFLRSREYLAVIDSSPAISAQAKAYGTPLPTTPKVYLFDDCCKGKHVVEYETYRYLFEQGQPFPYENSLDEIRAFGTEVCPEYFGEFPVPTETPWGPSLRHDRLWNGLYWLDTKKVGWVLAIAYPLCSGLWDDTLRLAELNKYDREKGIDNTFGYYFYTYRSSCLPIYEMIAFEAETWGPKINEEALQNAVRQFFPAYGSGDGESGPKFEQGRYIHLTMGAGTEFYRFPE